MSCICKLHIFKVHACRLLYTSAVKAYLVSAGAWFLCGSIPQDLDLADNSRGASHFPNDSPCTKSS